MHPTPLPPLLMRDDLQRGIVLQSFFAFPKIRVRRPWHDDSIDIGNR